MEKARLVYCDALWHFLLHRKETGLFLKASRMQENYVEKAYFVQKAENHIHDEERFWALSSKGECMFASRKQVAIECWQNTTPKGKDVRYIFYFHLWDRIERL